MLDATGVIEEAECCPAIEHQRPLQERQHIDGSLSHQVVVGKVLGPLVEGNQCCGQGKKKPIYILCKF